jgi:hypothetical protein
MKTDYVCPQCATFNISNNKGLECTSCGYKPNKFHIKIVHDYAKHVYFYGHMYRSEYQNQFESHGKVTVKFGIKPDSIYAYIGLAMLSGVIGNFAWHIIKNAADKIIESYNYRYGVSESISENELKEIFESYKIFINHFDEINKEVKMAILEEILAHESGKSGKKAMENTLLYESTNSARKKSELKKQNEKLAKHISKEIRNKLDEIKRAKNENFEDYWAKVKIEQ